MVYDRVRYERDRKLAWRKTKPRIIKGLKSPWVAGKAGNAKIIKVELKNWLLGWGYGLGYLLKLLFLRLRLKFNV